VRPHPACLGNKAAAHEAGAPLGPCGRRCNRNICSSTAGPCTGRAGRGAHVGLRAEHDRGAAARRERGLVGRRYPAGIARARAAWRHRSVAAAVGRRRACGLLARAHARASLAWHVHARGGGRRGGRERLQAQPTATGACTHVVSSGNGLHALQTRCTAGAHAMGVQAACHACEGAAAR